MTDILIAAMFLMQAVMFADFATHYFEKHYSARPKR